MIRRRLRDAAADMGHWTEFDYVLVNDEFARALADLASIVHGQGHASRQNRPGLAGLAAELSGQATRQESG